MKVLLTHRFFWPDTAPYAIMLRVIAKELVQAGHKVHVLASIPSYRETEGSSPSQEIVDGAHLRRVWVLAREKSSPVRRALNVVIYAWHLCAEILRLRPDVVTASTFPPVIAAWCASLAARWVGAKFVYHMQDIHPEISKINGGLLGKRLPVTILRWLDNQTLKRSAVIIVLSEDMAQTIQSRGIKNLQIEIINNFSLSNQTGDAKQPPDQFRKVQGRLRLIFAGNLGRYQNLMLLSDGVANLFQHYPNLELFFLGDGASLPDLKQRWADHEQVKFAPFLPYDQAQTLIAESDIGLVSLSPGIYRAAYPSKVLTYLELGLPIFAMVETESKLAHTLQSNKIGSAPKEFSIESISEALTTLLEKTPPKTMIKKYYSENFERNQVMSKWTTLIDLLDVSKKSTKPTEN